MLSTHKVERHTTLPQDGSRTLHFVIRTGRRPWAKFFSVAEVPEFEGNEAWFEVDKSKARWKIVRQVEGPG